MSHVAVRKNGKQKQWKQREQKREAKTQKVNHSIGFWLDWVNKFNIIIQSDWSVLRDKSQKQQRQETYKSHTKLRKKNNAMFTHCWRLNFTHTHKKKTTKLWSERNKSIQSIIPFYSYRICFFDTLNMPHSSCILMIFFPLFIWEAFHHISNRQKVDFFPFGIQLSYK